MSIDLDYDHHARRFSLKFRGHVLVTLGSILVPIGLSAIFTPWWYPLLSIAMSLVGLSADPLVNSLLGGLVFASGLGCFAYKYFGIDVEVRQIAGDQRLLKDCAPSPVQIRAYFDGLTTDDSYWSSADSRFQDEYTRHTASERHLLHPKTAALYDKFSESASKLHRFISGNFELYPRHQTGPDDYRYCLAPELNIDRARLPLSRADEVEYVRLRDALDQQVKKAKSDYDAYITKLRELGHL